MRREVEKPIAKIERYFMLLLLLFFFFFFLDGNISSCFFFFFLQLKVKIQERLEELSLCVSRGSWKTKRERERENG